jgi:Protein of unknown function (DUF2934)
MIISRGIMARATKAKSYNGNSVDLNESTSPIAYDEKTRARIAERAYLLYEERGCVHGHDEEDWLVAERLVLAELNAQPKRASRSTPRRKTQKAAQ